MRPARLYRVHCHVQKERNTTEGHEQHRRSGQGCKPSYVVQSPPITSKHTNRPLACRPGSLCFQLAPTSAQDQTPLGT